MVVLGGGAVSYERGTPAGLGLPDFNGSGVVPSEVGNVRGAVPNFILRHAFLKKWLLSEYDTDKTAKARFWPALSGKSRS